MKVFNSTKLTLVLTALVVTAYAAKTPNTAVKNHQYQGCITVAGKRCLQCYRRQVRSNLKGCGPLLPPTDKCEIYSRDNAKGGSHCAKCKKSLALKSSGAGKDYKTSCVPGQVKDCEDEELRAGKTPICYACTYGFAQFDKETGKYHCVAYRCGPYGCQIGGQVGCDYQGLSCYRCYGGFALTVKKSKKKCVKPHITGCGLNSPIENGCLKCDVYRGFYQVPGGACVKGPALKSG